KHLLIGLLHQQRTKVNRLFGLVAHRDDFRKQLQLPKKKLQVFGRVGDIPLSLPSKRALAYASEEAVLLGSKSVDTGHLLLGLLRESESDVPGVLATAGVNVDSARNRIKEDRDETSEQSLLKPITKFVLVICVIVAIYLIIRVIGR